MSKLNHYLYYIEGCSPILKEFKSKAKMETFMKKFLKKHEDNKDDNWIDYSFQGTNVTNYQGEK